MSKQIVSSTNDGFYVTVSNDGNYVSYSYEPVSNWKPVAGERLLTHAFLRDSFRKIMGRTLTLIDASVHEPQQNKAMKDIIRNIFSDELEFSTDWAFDQEEIQKLIPEDIDPKELETISVEKALGVEE